MTCGAVRLRPQANPSVSFDTYESTNPCRPRGCGRADRLRAPEKCRTGGDADAERQARSTADRRDDPSGGRTLRLVVTTDGTGWIGQSHSGSIARLDIAGARFTGFTPSGAPG